MIANTYRKGFRRNHLHILCHFVLSFLLTFSTLPLLAHTEDKIAIINHLDFEESVMADFLSPDFLEVVNENSNEEELRIADYLAFLFQFDDYLGPLGNSRQHEIEVIVDPKKIIEIQESEKFRLLKMGSCEEDATAWSRVGILQMDTYLIWLRDAVCFPSGMYGVFDRIICKSSLDGPTCVSILPLLQDGRIVLLLNYRHPTRSWEIELPRGLRVYGETIEKAALRELREETGLIASKPILLGAITRDTSSSNTVMPVFLCHVIDQVDSHEEYSEAILGLLAFTKEELKEAFKRGFVEIKHERKVLKISMRDSSLAFAFLQAELAGYL